MSKIFFLGPGYNPQRDRVERHFRNILGRRLQSLSFASHDICAYLGEEYLPISELAIRLARNRRDAYFAGWPVVWQLADRNVRNLIDLVSSIFKSANVTAAAKPTIIAPHIQNAGITMVSEARLRGLEYIPGKLELGAGGVSVGQHLHRFAVSFGSVAKAYLTRSVGAARLDERIAIERNDSAELSIQAGSVLEALLRFGVLDEGQYTIAREDQLKKPLYILNRIFCPAFKISFRRDQHLRLSRRMLEVFLLDPIRFSRVGTRYLRQRSGAKKEDTLDLFES